MAVVARAAVPTIMPPAEGMRALRVEFVSKSIPLDAPTPRIRKDPFPMS